MEKLKIEFKNCHGIKYLKKDFDFSCSNTQLIYARNGMMKTSFLKTFEDYKNGVVSRDNIENVDGERKIDGVEQDQVITFHSFGNIHLDSKMLFFTLLDDVEKKFIKELKNYIPLGSYSGNRNEIIKNLFLLQLLRNIHFESMFGLGIEYWCDTFLPEPILFLDIRSAHESFTAGIPAILFEFYDEDLINKSNIDPIHKELFHFIKNQGGYNYENKFDDGVFAGLLEEREKYFMILLDFIYNLLEFENFKDGPSLKEDFNCLQNKKPEDFGLSEDFFTFIKENKKLFLQIAEKIEKLDDLEKIISAEIVDKFNVAFSFPYRLKLLKNLEFDYSYLFFEKKDKENNGFLEGEENKMDTLSQGEKRALYLFKIFYQIELLKKDDKEYLLIFDDIVDSFDYKNKYAILSYLQEIDQNEKFKLIILTHNFDFFRSVSSRFDNPEKEKWRFLVKKDKNDVTNLCLTDKDLTNPFGEWIRKAKEKKGDFEKYIIALIPFSREIFKFKGGKEVEIFNKILHGSSQKLSDLIDVYKRLYDFPEDYLIGEKEEEKLIFDFIDDISQNIIDNTVDELVDKVILSLSIRLHAEYFLNKTSDEMKKESKFPRKILLYEKSEYYNERKYNILRQVNIMTPENIHLNSFMYEPLIDMDVWELKELYKKVSSLEDDNKTNT